MPEIVTVFGATGAQGGGLARAILGDRERRFSVRVREPYPGLQSFSGWLARHGSRIPLH